MNTLKMIPLLLLLCTALISCYEDKGNYDYIQVNEVTIECIEDEYEIIRWDTLVIPVTLKNSLGEPSSLLYSWYLDGKKIADTQNLQYVVSEKSKKYDARFEVLDPVSDSVRFFGDFKVAVHAQYAKGLLMLSRVENIPELSFISKVDSSNTEIINGIFEMENGIKMEGEPLNLEQSDVWSYGGVIFVHTSRRSHQLDPTYFKEIFRFDETTMTEKEPEYNMLFCTFEGIPDFGAAIGANHRVYSKVSRQERFSSPSLLPVHNEDSLNQLINYSLTPMALVGRDGSLVYDELGGNFMFFSTSWDIESYDSEQYTMAYVSKTHIGMPWIGWGKRMRNSNIASLFYDKESDKAALVPMHNYRGVMRGKDSLVVLEKHYLDEKSEMLVNPSDDYLYYSDGGNGIYMIDLADPEVKYASIKYECKLPETGRITLLKMASDNKSIYVGLLTDREEKYNGDLYRLNIATGEIMEYYRGFGGEPVVLIEKQFIDGYETE